MCEHIWVMKPFNGTWKWQCYKCGVITNYITSARNWDEDIKKKWSKVLDI